MNSVPPRWRRYSFAVVAAFVVACSAAVDPGNQSAASPPGIATASNVNENREPDLGSCQNLRPPTGSTLAYHVYAEGVQIWHWTGTAWAFDGPSALLYADAEGKGVVGTHSFGPTWTSLSGGKVEGTLLDRCSPNPNAIPWLVLSAVSEGPGVFDGVIAIQRLYTTGGIAPSNAGSFVGEEARVPYSTEYFFYRAK